MTELARQGSSGLPKAPTGIPGLDEITHGGLPKGRPTLVCGSAGAGKTMLAIECLVRGATQFDEPGVFMMFEETSREITENVRSLGFDLARLESEGRIALDHVHIERSEIEETGEYDLEGLFIRLGHAVDSIGAKRVVLDTLEALFAGLPNHAILRAELRRLFRWLKDRGLTAIITAERGETSLTRFGLEEYVADCVLILDHRVADEISTRRLRVMKYRGSAHGTNEYPFLIGERGISVVPITSLRLDHEAVNERVSTGIPGLDAMLGGKGYFRGSSVLLSGPPGTGKSSVCAAFLDAACRRGERALLFAFEESAAQILRNMRSIGIDLEPHIRQGLLVIHASRPTLQGLEQHLVMMHDVVNARKPSIVCVDPISSLIADSARDVRPVLLRLMDFLKVESITGMFTSLTRGSPGEAPEDSQVAVSSLMDTWLQVRNLETNGERNRTLYVLKSRGMAHSHQVREFILTDDGLHFLDVCLRGDAVLTGTARLAQGARERARQVQQRVEHERQMRLQATRRKALEARIALLQADLDNQIAEMESASAADEALELDARPMAAVQGAPDPAPAPPTPKPPRPASKVAGNSGRQAHGDRHESQPHR